MPETPYLDSPASPSDRRSLVILLHDAVHEALKPPAPSLETGPRSYLRLSREEQADIFAVAQDEKVRDPKALMDHLKHIHFLQAANRLVHELEKIEESKDTVAHLVAASTRINIAMAMCSAGEEVLAQDRVFKGFPKHNLSAISGALSERIYNSQTAVVTLTA